jgi:hypothetical protein
MKNELKIYFVVSIALVLIAVVISRFFTSQNIQDRLSLQEKTYSVQPNIHTTGSLLYSVKASNKILTFFFRKRWLEDINASKLSLIDFVLYTEMFFARQKYYTSRQYFSSLFCLTQSLRGPPFLL